MKLGNLIKEYRESHDLSQRQFAMTCGLSNGYISMLEKGKNPKTGRPVTPTLQQLKKLADGMGTTMMDMLEQVDDMPVDLATEAHSLAGKTISTPGAKGGYSDSIDLELATLILQLSPEKKKEAVNYLHYLAGREDS